VSATMNDYFRVLVVGGTGAISHSCVLEAVAEGMRVTALNRGRSSMVRSLPESVESLTADITDPPSVEAALGDRHFDAVVNFLCFGADNAALCVELFGDRTRHYVHISSASVYHRPLPKGPVSESTYAHNPNHAYMRDKAEAEKVFLAAFAEHAFPVTIVRPAHTYDEAIAPLPGGWAVIDRIERGEPVVVHGDGTSMWTYTHAADLAVGLVGLLGRPSAFGEAFHITSNDVLSWNQIYAAIGHAMGVEPKILHVPTELIILAEPDWFWSGLLDGDLSHTEIYDNTKISNYVPGFSPTRVFEREIYKILAWRKAHPDLAKGQPEQDAVYTRLAANYEHARAAFARR
jgi:nucleoside-diphosphate-sugar epimerase